MDLAQSANGGEVLVATSMENQHPPSSIIDACACVRGCGYGGDGSARCCRVQERGHVLGQHGPVPAGPARGVRQAVRDRPSRMPIPTSEAHGRGAMRNTTAAVVPARLRNRSLLRNRIQRTVSLTSSRRLGEPRRRDPGDVSASDGSGPVHQNSHPGRVRRYRCSAQCGCRRSPDLGAARYIHSPP